MLAGTFPFRSLPSDDRRLERPCGLVGRSRVLGNSRQGRVLGMTSEEQIRRLEDVVILLGNVVERRLGAFGTDLDPATAAEGDRVHQWASAVRVERERS
jgi:hypothetical protein